MELLNPLTTSVINRDKACEPLRVAHVMGRMVGGGVEAVVLNYWRHMDKRRIVFDFIIDDDSLVVPLEEMKEDGGRVIEVPSYRRQFNNAHVLEWLFKSQNYSIVHSHLNSLSVIPLGAAKRAGVPVRIAHSHSTSGGNELVRNAIKSILRTQSNRYPTHRVACSTHAGEWLFGQNKPFTIVPSAIDLERFAYSEEARKRIRHELDIDEDALVIGHVGRFVPQKNQLFLLDIFKEIVQIDASAILVLVGDGDLDAIIRNRAAALGLLDRVRFLGRRPDVALVYSAFDRFVMPSTYEGLGMVAVEAQRSGLPCIVSDNVQKDVVCTPFVTRVPLSISVRDWAALVVTAERSKTRNISEEELASFEGFDIRPASQRLAQWYEGLAGKYSDQEQVILSR